MRLPEQILLGMTIFAFTTIGHATPAKQIKEDAKEKADIEFPIVEPGTRLFAGEPDQNEFYILRKNEPDPVIHVAAKVEKAKEIPAPPVKSLVDISTHDAFDMLKQLNQDIKLQYTPVETVEVKSDVDSKPVINVSQKVT